LGKTIIRKALSGNCGLLTIKPYSMNNSEMKIMDNTLYG